MTTRFFLAMNLAVTTAMVSLPAAAQSGHAVDVELALLLDVSSSVDDREFRLQANGLASAFRSSAVIDAIRGAGPNGLAVTVIQWSNVQSQVTTIPWTLVRDQADSFALAARLADMPRLIHSGHTAPGDALTFALRELEANRYHGRRQVIDLSGDGPANDGRALESARARVLAAGVTINGLAIVQKAVGLERYFRTRLIGGSGAFVEVAESYDDFARTMTKKLIREIGPAPLGRTIASLDRFAANRPRRSLT